MVMAMAMMMMMTMIIMVVVVAVLILALLSFFFPFLVLLLLLLFPPFSLCVLTLAWSSDGIQSNNQSAHGGNGCSSAQRSSGDLPTWTPIGFRRASPDLDPPLHPRALTEERIGRRDLRNFCGD